MKKISRFLAVVVVTFFAVSMLFTGCGSTTQDGTTQGSTAQESSSAAQATTQPVQNIELKWYTDSDDATNKQRKYPEFAANFEKENPGVKVTLQPLVANFNTEEYAKKLNIMLAASEQVDVILNSTLEEVTTKVSNGVLEPLNSYAEKAGINLEEEFNGMIQLDGKYYTIPTYTTMWLVYMNKDMLDAAGLPIPPKDWTWADYREYAKKLTKGEGANKVYGSYFHTWDWFYAIGMQGAIKDKPYFTPDGNLNIDNPVFKDGMKFRYEMENVDKSQVPFADIKAQNMAYRSVFFNGKAAMVPMGAWMVSDIQMQDKYPHTFKTVFAAWPKWNANDTPNTTTLDGAGSGWGVNANSKYKDMAFKLVYEMNSKGNELAHKQWSAWKKADAEATIKGMAGPDESLYDLQSLKDVLFDPNKNPNMYTYVGPGEQEFLDMYISENEKYLLGSQSLDKTMENIKKQGEQIVAKAKAQ